MNEETKFEVMVALGSSTFYLIIISLAIFFYVVGPHLDEVSEKLLHYPEDLYKKYQKEAERMIDKNEYTCQYPVERTFYSEGDRTTLVMKIGDYDKEKNFSHYLTATVRNYGTNEQKVTFERSIKSAEESNKKATIYGFYYFVIMLIFVIGPFILPMVIYTIFEKLCDWFDF